MQTLWRAIQRTDAEAMAFKEMQENGSVQKMFQSDRKRERTHQTFAGMRSRHETGTSELTSSN